MEIETYRPINKRPPLPNRKAKVETSQTTIESPHSQNNQNFNPIKKQKQKRVARFPPLHMPRSISLSRNSSSTDLSRNQSKPTSQERASTKGSLRSSNRSIKPVVSQRLEMESIERVLENQNLFVPNVSAHSWIVYEMNKGKFIHGKRIHKKRQMASLTKIMNLITAIQLIQKLNIDYKRVVVRVSRHASNIIGTTASLKPGMQLTLYDLMFGMMLPSGNDAAFCLAEYLGSIMMQKTYKIDDIIYDVDKLNKLRLSKKNPVYRFLEEMNKLAKGLGMQNSRFTNPHGLSQVTNLSTADNLAKLCCYAMKNKLFMSVVNTREYKINVRIYTESQPLLEQGEFQKQYQQQNIVEEYQEVQMSWINTNKMLWQGWNGVKTGITPNAGPCLAASVEKVINGQYFHILVILLSSSSMQVRWKEVKQIAKWAVTQNLIY